MKAAASTVVSVRAPLAMAMVHVLQALPLAVKDAQIPWLITTMVGPPQKVCIFCKFFFE